MVDMAHDLETENYWAIDRIKEDLDKVYCLCTLTRADYYLHVLNTCNLLLTRV